MDKICVLGLGYIGLPTAAMFAANGCQVLGVDVNTEVVEALNKGRITIEEPGLGALVLKAVESGRLTAKTAPEKADAFLICVPTPIKNDKSAEMKYVAAATESILPHLEKGNCVILESTSPPRTVEDLICPILNRAGFKLGEDIYVAHSPERVIPGKIIEELQNNDRVVGGVNPQSAQVVKQLYEKFVQGTIYLTDATTAEMCKLMENTFRDVNIALANELASIAERLGINAWEVIEYANKHPRVNLHQPGPGVGGHCIAVDPWFIVEKTPDLANLIALSRKTNDNMPHVVADKAEKILGGLEKKTVVLLGASYKADIDDMRESPTMALAAILEAKGAIVKIVDPHIARYKENYQNICGTVEDAHLLVLAVNHKLFAQLDFKTIQKKMATANLLDTRNFYNRAEAEQAGFRYSLLGAADQ